MYKKKLWKIWNIYILKRNSLKISVQADSINLRAVGWGKGGGTKKLAPPPSPSKFSIFFYP